MTSLPGELLFLSPSHVSSQFLIIKLTIAIAASSYSSLPSTASLFIEAFFKEHRFTCYILVAAIPSLTIMNNLKYNSHFEPLALILYV